MITSPVLSAPYDNVLSKNIGSHNLLPSDGKVNSGPDFLERGLFYSYNHVPVTYTLNSNLAGFMGNGEIEFNYETTTDLYPSGSNHAFNGVTEDSGLL